MQFFTIFHDKSGVLTEKYLLVANVGSEKKDFFCRTSCNLINLDPKKIKFEVFFFLNCI